MPLYGGFYPETVETITEALHFIMKKMSGFFTVKKSAVDMSHHALIDREYNEQVKLVDQVRLFMEKSAGYGSYQLDAKTNESYMDIVRSALEIYLQDTLKAQAETGLLGFDLKVKEIRRSVNLEGLRNRKTDLFVKYYQSPIKSLEGRKIEIFFSYATEDKALAGSIAAILIKRDIDVFLAHEDIEISEEWRKEILNHLMNDNTLIALLTPNYEKSVWANQEAGYMMGKGGRNIPLIAGETDIKNFGFLESFQGIQVEEENLEDCADKIIGVVSNEIMSP